MNSKIKAKKISKLVDYQNYLIDLWYNSNRSDNNKVRRAPTPRPERQRNQTPQFLQQNRKV